MDRLKIIQSNCGRGRITTYNLIELNKREKAGVLAIQEPYTSLDNRVVGFSNEFDIVSGDLSNRPKAALVISKKLNAVQITKYTNHFMATAELRTKGRTFVLVSLYLNLVNEDETERDIAADLQKVQQLLDGYEGRQNVSTIIMTDSNCRHSLWGDHVETVRERDELLVNFIEANELAISNKIEQGPTFVRYMKDKKNPKKLIECKSFIDLTITNRTGAEWIAGWKLVDEIHTEHRQIIFELNASDERAKEPSLTGKLYNMNRTNWLVFDREYQARKPDLKIGLPTEKKLEKLAEELTEAIVDALEASTPKLVRRSTDQPWYNQALRKKKCEIDRTRKRLRLNDARPLGVRLAEELHELNREYKRLTRTAKREYYERINQVNSTQDL